jgi:membrane protease subunit (stomatin/prohibitin family)
MARVFDVIEYPNEMREEIVHRFPETGSGDFRIGSQVIVRESQLAVFFRDGNALDVFGPGRHTITTFNIPLLIDFIGRTFFNERNPFPAEVYFVSMREFADRKWGTPQPIIVRNPGMGLGVALLQGFGTFSFQVKDAQQFVTQLVGAQGIYEARCRRCFDPLLAGAPSAKSQTPNPKPQIPTSNPNLEGQTPNPEHRPTKSDSQPA